MAACLGVFDLHHSPQATHWALDCSAGCVQRLEGALWPACQCWDRLHRLAGGRRWTPESSSNPSCAASMSWLFLCKRACAVLASRLAQVCHCTFAPTSACTDPHHCMHSHILNDLPGRAWVWFAQSCPTAGNLPVSSISTPGVKEFRVYAGRGMCKQMQACRHLTVQGVCRERNVRADEGLKVLSTQLGKQVTEAHQRAERWRGKCAESQGQLQGLTEDLPSIMHALGCTIPVSCCQVHRSACCWVGSSCTPWAAPYP